MRPYFVAELASVPNFSLRDVALFHYLPLLPCVAGVYETSYSSFASMVRVDRNTVKNFFEKLEASGLVEVLRNGKKRGKNSSVAFTARETTLHNFNYSTTAGVSPIEGKVFSLRNNNVYYIELPSGFFKHRIRQSIYLELKSYLCDPTYANETVHNLLQNYLLVEHRASKRSRVSFAG